MSRALRRHRDLHEFPFIMSFRESGSESGSQPESVDESALLRSKGRRRSKHDRVDRPYQCGCGKEYLSYPALYTHVKNKHQGTQPVGTVVPDNRKNKGRGRPRKNSEGGQEGSEREGVETPVETYESLQSLGYFGGPAVALLG